MIADTKLVSKGVITKLLEDSVSLNLQGQEKRYTKHIKAMEAELDARKKQEMKDLREERRFDSGT
jgi:hypothetical protein